MSLFLCFHLCFSLSLCTFIIVSVIFVRLNEQPVGNMFEWHFTFLGAKGTPFEGGLYHGSISLPENYPKSGPSVRMLNPNQRFKVSETSRVFGHCSRRWW